LWRTNPFNRKEGAKMWLFVFIVVALALALAWFKSNTSEDFEDCSVCCIGVKKRDLVFVNLKGRGWTTACPHCVNVYGVDETPEGKVISTSIPYWNLQPVQTKE